MSGIDDLAARNVTVRKFVSVSPEAVFRLWTDAGLLKKWWGPPGVTCTEAEIDLRVGGSYRIANQLPTGATIWIHGQYEEIDRPRLLRYSWGIGLDSPPEEVVTVRFEPKDGGTEVIVFHENAPDISTRESHEHGWAGCLDGLAEVAASDVWNRPAP